MSKNQNTCIGCGTPIEAQYDACEACARPPELRIYHSDVLGAVTVPED